MNKMISMAELSRKLKVNKSKLAYYVSKGLLEPEFQAGGMYLFDEKKVRETLVDIKKMQRRKHSLEEIKSLLE